MEKKVKEPTMVDVYKFKNTINKWIRFFCGLKEI